MTTPAELADQSPISFGWRSAVGVELSREQARQAWNTPWGPCARCGAKHRRYGEGGGPLCPACRGVSA